MRTCVTPEQTFRYGLHQPSYTVKNLRQRTIIEPIGTDGDGREITNEINFPNDNLFVEAADWIYEIANPLPFRGVTFIGKSWADRSAEQYERITIAEPDPLSLSDLLHDRGIAPDLIDHLPRPLLLALATSSTDPIDLIRLAQMSCSFVDGPDGSPTGLRYSTATSGTQRADIRDHDLFEAVANNPALPGDYKIAMVIRPGVQGDSEIVGDVHDGSTHIHEYLRRNSYIGGGHYAANMAEDAVRYRIADLTNSDLQGLRHLYYQRTYVQLAARLGIDIGRAPLTPETLETLRRAIAADPRRAGIDQAATLWGWNFGFDFAPTGYRLHASHQQVHQQYALIPSQIAAARNGDPADEGYQPFSCGDLVAETIDHYRHEYGRDFFCDYLQAIRDNHRMDGRHDREASLIVWQDARVMLFVPKAQTSQWELQIMTLPGMDGNWPGNILETDTATRASLDHALLTAQRALAGRGAKMVTSIEFSKRFSSPQTAQPLIYSLLPKIPQSPGAFSEAQLRFINGHYPEDFAAVCRQSIG